MRSRISPIAFTAAAVAAVALAASLNACRSAAPVEPAARTAAPRDWARLDAALGEIFAEHGLQTAGVGVIAGGELAWAGYYGEQRPGVAASRETLFNVASIAKVVTAETILRLAAAGELALDEPMAADWVDPDLADDPRHRRLTPRMALTHTTGFPNWRLFLEDRRLRFLEDPGTTFGYSGEGFEYVARYAQEKLGRDFAELVRERVLAPSGMTDASFAIREETFDRIARPLTSDGEFLGHYCRPNGWCREPGSWSAADDLVVSVESFARFLLAAMTGEGYGEELAAERFRIQSRRNDAAERIDCGAVPGTRCPVDEGYGLGWEVFDLGGGEKLVGHGGSDWAEVALGYFSTASRDGLVIFLNGPPERALPAMATAVGVVDPGSPLAARYRRWAALAAAKAAE